MKRPEEKNCNKYEMLEMLIQSTQNLCIRADLNCQGQREYEYGQKLREKTDLNWQYLDLVRESIEKIPS